MLAIFIIFLRRVMIRIPMNCSMNSYEFGDADVDDQNPYVQKGGNARHFFKLFFYVQKGEMLAIF